ncbi:MAG: hypothetical protein Q9215_004593 [Flavoplaca cf. flavocitrina]
MQISRGSESCCDVQFRRGKFIQILLANHSVLSQHIGGSKFGVEVLQKDRISPKVDAEIHIPRIDVTPMDCHEATDDRPAADRQTTEVGEKLSALARPKSDHILDSCGEEPDIGALVRFATSPGGLVNDEVRGEVCLPGPLLLGYNPLKKAESTETAAWQHLPRHKDEDQVRLDVDRSFIYYPKTQDQSEPQLDRRKGELSAVITTVLRQHPILSYFQGFHDIVQVFLLVLGVDHAAAAVSRLSLLRIRDFMLPSLEPSLAHLHLLPSILEAECPKLRQHLSQTQPFFALAATLTLYAHDIQEYSDIARLFDFFLAHGAMVSVYFFAIIILSRRDELFEIPADEPEMLHSVLSKLPKPLDLEALIAQTVSLYQKYPPENLPFRAWARISRYSVLKTTVRDFRQQTLYDGVEYFNLQVAQLRRQQMRRKAMATLWKNRRSGGRLGLAIFAGVVAIWLARGGAESYAAIAIRRMLDRQRDLPDLQKTETSLIMANRGYDVVVDVDDNEGDLGHTDLQEDLEFHSSNFNDTNHSKITPDSTYQPPSSSSGSSKRYLWTLSFYAQFFAVDTSHVLHRCFSALVPRRPFLDILDGNPDLYGPFWIATTVVFILFLTGTISQYLASHHDKAFVYNFKLLSGAAGLIYGYTAIVPIALWGLLKWFGSGNAPGESNIGLVECWALYGYANVIWIPVALISWSPISILNYVFVAVGFAVSALFLTKNLWPVVSVTEAKVSRILVIGVVAAHAGLAIAIKFLFFA